jgi:beta-aspartyl-dipeptidase (metallo-type)
MLGGKAGIVHLHMGDARDPFSLVYQAEERSELPLTQFLPTHCNRNPHILEAAKSFGKRGLVDLTAVSFSRDPGKNVKPSRAVVELLEAGVPLAHITVSSDGCGSLPSFDADGNLLGLETGEPSSILVELRDLVEREGLPLEGALPVMTSNVSRALKLHRKGRLAVGMDADLVLLDSSMQIRHLVARGEILVRDGELLRKGTFEK